MPLAWGHTLSAVWTHFDLPVCSAGAVGTRWGSATSIPLTKAVTTNWCHMDVEPQKSFPVGSLTHRISWPHKLLPW